MKKQIKGIALIGGIIVLGLAIQLVNDWVQDKPKYYTIGTIEKVYSTANMRIHALYNYNSNGTSYQGTINIYGFEEIAIPKNRFIVSIPIGFDTEGVLMFDQPVPDGIEAPKEGWKEIPSFK